MREAIKRERLTTDELDHNRKPGASARAKAASNRRYRRIGKAIAKMWREHWARPTR